MSNDRRDFIRKSLIAGAGFGMIGSNAWASEDKDESQNYNQGETKSIIRIAFIGVGLRGQVHLQECLKRKDVQVMAICDPDKINAIPSAKKIIEKYLGTTNKVTEFSNGEEDYIQLLQRKDIDAVIISTPWEWHTRQGVLAMQKGIAVGMEVGGATDIQECWDLVNTFESTGTPFFGLENVCYRRDVMAVLNMVRQNLFGEILHLQGGYQHDLRHVKFNDGKQYYGGGVEFGEKGISEARWRTNHSVHRNGELYPTHGLGPVGTMINVNRGNRLVGLTSVATKARGLHKYVVEKGGKDHPNAKVEFKLGDVVTTLITTSNGETIMLSHDTNSPRPYSLNFRVQGTQGLWMDDIDSVYVEGRSKQPHKWESAGEYMKEYDHPLWIKYAAEAEGAGHGGMDFFVVHSFIESLKRNESCALDVYDLATWYVITPLSEASVAQGGQLQQIPDFTRGKWMNRKPIFALDDRY